MSVKYPQLSGVGSVATPQRQKMTGEPQELNAAGGYVYAIDERKRLERFLSLGTEGGTYYIGERDLTKENVESVLALIAGAPATVQQIVAEYAQPGRVVKHDPVLFVYALLLAKGKDAGVKSVALAQFNAIVRIPTHLFTFLSYYKHVGGKWSRSIRTAIANWYLDKEPKDLAYHLVKYRQRDGWTHRDALRLAHPTPRESNALLLRYAVKGEIVHEGVRNELFEQFPLIAAYERWLTMPKPDAQALREIAELRAPREAVPTGWLTDRDVWWAMLEAGIPYNALVRNLPQLSRVGLLDPGSDGQIAVVGQITTEAVIRASGIHPIQLLVAAAYYTKGEGRGGRAWTPNSKVTDSLTDAFYKAFVNVPVTGKRVLVAVDESGSMQAPASGIPLTAAEVAAAMALITVATEPRSEVVAFDTTARHVDISARQRLSDVIAVFDRGGGTDTAQPILWALNHKWQYDAIVLYTDNETWYGSQHTVQALDRYRREHGPAKFVAAATAATAHSVNRQDDPLSLDVVGFDATAPKVIGDFIAGP